MNTPVALEPTHLESRAPRSPENGSGSRQPKSRWWVWMILLAIAGYGGYRVYQVDAANKKTAAEKKEQKGPHEIPVVSAFAHSGDMPVYLRGLGSVTAFNTVTVKPRVDGQLIKVAFQEGQLVKAGDVLAELDPRPLQVALDQAEGGMAKDQAVLKDAQANYARDQELFNAQIIARQQLDTQAAAVSESKGSLEADQAAIDNAKLQLSFTKIVSPISGRIGLRQVDAGNMVHAADTTGIAVITQLHPIAVLFNLPEDQLPPVLKKLYAGQKLRADAYDRNETTKLGTGTLETVDNEIDQTTGTSRLKAVFGNEDNALFPNQFVNVKLLLETKRGAVLMPTAGVQRGPIGTFVYLVKPDNTVTVRPIKLGTAEGANVVIDGGLEPGDQMVIDGAEKLTEGMKVVARAANSRDNTQDASSRRAGE